jgi:hypothetical protein
MNSRDKIIKEILSDKEIMEKYNIRENELNNLTASPPYFKKIIEVIATIINENDNNLSSNQIYKKIKIIHKV